MAKTSARHLYALALGSNRALSARMTPVRLLDEAVRRIAALGQVRGAVAVSPDAKVTGAEDGEAPEVSELIERGIALRRAGKSAPIGGCGGRGAR